MAACGKKKQFKFGKGVVFEVPTWRQGSLSIEPKEMSAAAVCASHDNDTTYTLTFHYPYRTCDKHKAPMQEGIVDVTAKTEELMQAASIDTPVLLGELSVLMAFFGGAPVLDSLLIIPSRPATAISSAMFASTKKGMRSITK